LLATPSMRDPNFERAVILLVAHGDDGALGIVVNGNKPVACVGDLLEQLSLVDDASKFKDEVRLGGPVQPEIGWLVYRPSAEVAREGEIKLTDSVAVTQSREVLAAIGRSEGPAQYAAYLGYAGWAPGQLDEELRRGAWLPATIDASIVFDVAVDDRWKRAYALAGVTPAGLLASQRPGARGLA
jgi:putative transcriptional regulator